MNSPVQELKEAALLHNISLCNEDAEKLVTYLLAILRKNEDINLTRITSLEEGIQKHLIDSLIAGSELTKYRDANSSLIDIGTGGGFPGVPMAIYTGFKTSLLDSVNKKVTAVQEVLKELELGDFIKTTCARAEDYAKEHYETFDFAVSRAVAGLSTDLEYASPLIKQGGYACFLKGNLSEKEIIQTQEAAELCGMAYVSRETYQLSEEAGRALLIYKKVSAPKINLPRRIGMAKKNPL